MDTQLSLAAACAEFALDNEARRLTPRTRATYAASLRPFVAWCDGQGVTHAGDVSPAIVRRYLVHLQARTTQNGRPYSSAYVHNLVRAVRRLFAYLLSDGLIERTPFEKVRLPRLERKVLRALSPAEVKRVLSACKTPRDGALVRFLLDTGVRAAELCALDIGDVDFAAGAVTVRSGKGQKGRYVYAGAATRKALRRYRDVLLWGFGDGGARKHWTWVAKGNTAALVAWAREREESDGWEVTPTPAAVADAGQWAQAGLFDA